MKKSLLKKIIIAASGLLSLVFACFIKVSAVNTIELGESMKGDRDAGNSNIFTFVSDAASNKMFGLARAFIIIGFILLAISVIYFIAILVLEILKKENLIKKLSLVTKIMQGVIVLSVVFILVAGLDYERIEKGYARETLNISLFGFPFALAFAFSIAPIACEYLVEDK